MTKEWKAAIREKRKTAAKKFAKERTPENWELKGRTVNKATHFRRIALRKYTLGK